MVSLEKKMFFLPYKLYAKKDKLLVSFNLAVIPKDMKVKAIELHIPLIKSNEAHIVKVAEITEGWSEETIKLVGIPKERRVVQIVKSIPQQRELIINVTAFHKKWRVKKDNNYGVLVSIKNLDLGYLENKPPFLVVDTI